MIKSESESGVEESVNTHTDYDRLPICLLSRMLIQAGHWNAHFKRFGFEILITIIILLFGVLFFYLGSHHFDHRTWYHSISIITLPCAFLWTYLKTQKGPPFFSGDFGTPKSPKYLRRIKDDKDFPPSGTTKEEMAAVIQQERVKRPENVPSLTTTMSLPLV